jgi:UDP-3-O-[3-hydroxymyristoyl] glucosamine N-acyltransferase
LSDKMRENINKEKKIEIKVSELAEKTSAELRGDPELLVDSARGIEESKKGSVTFADKKEYFKEALNSEASVIVTKSDFQDFQIETEKTLLLTDNPRRVYAQIADILTKRPYYSGIISDKAVIDDSVELGSNLSIHAGAVIAENVKIADDSILAPGVIIGPDVEIGKGTLLHPGVIIERDTIIGDHVIIQSGAVIGSDGFGFATDENGHHKIPQQGNVIIESDVEIGANVTIDRGASGPTIIGRGSKLDNLIQIGHNVEVGEESLLVALSGIAGSTKLGRRVTLGGQAGVVGHIKLADNTTAAARAMVTSPTKEGDFISGAPARDHRDALKEQAALRRLPKYLKRIRDLEKEVEQKLAELENLDK